MDNIEYEICYNGNGINPRWRPISEARVRFVLSSFYKNVDDVLKQVRNGDIISYRGLRVKMFGMQAD